MKNKLASFLFGAAAVVATAGTGCKKSFLEDMRSYEKFDETMFTSEALTGAYIDRTYKDFFNNYRTPTVTVTGLYDNNRSNSTDELGGTVTSYINPTTELKQASQADIYFGDQLKASVVNNSYTRIRFANFLIEKVNGGAAQVLSDDFKKTAKGQMYMFRALQYFDLVRVYGGVPIVTSVEAASADDEAIKIPRAKTSEVIAQIVADLDSAAILLPMKWANVSTDYGRFTAAGAMALKSRVLLTAASPLFNANWDNAGDDHWQKALDAGLQAEAALTTAGYGGSITTAKDWSEVTFKNDNSFNGEALIVMLLSNTTNTSTGLNSSWENSLRPKDYNGGGGIAAPQAMIDLFPLANGSRPTAVNGYNPTYFYENRDPRFYRTFAFSGAKWGVKTNPNKVAWLYRWKKNDAATSGTFYANNQTNSPAIVRKMSNPAADSSTFANSGTDIFDMRYAELLLNIAECYAAQGKITECVTYLAKIRKRVYPLSAAANFYGIGTPGDKYAALEACLYERRVELAYEGKRFWDMQRWMLYDDDGSIGDNTNQLLNIAKLNGTSRQGSYWEAKVNNDKDPLTAADRASIAVDPDASDFAAQITKLHTLFDAKFKVTPLDNPWDQVNKAGVSMLFRSNYYVSGLHSSPLGLNSWLTQTIGWQDYYGNMGTYDYRQ
ncbi:MULTISPECIES: RagB/SusD family nutrient uptake outer membrane protein [Niastella]|uniref:RagB/SusD family nutrient uptake outer membrane protein n=1 Tax=Niastella soli TaxID=2821487 RepID=A0ABS3Z1L1_9BACT|nr:RagB/SusD family nutrient uptake outer membrane protein [Niastella soli]MBO9204049.1 RagB/SusD family nutrient uptake outer membrane protein [Niastella soli]